MRRRVELGEKYGRWIVVAFNYKTPDGRLYWSCHCECGNIGIVAGPSLLGGHSQSCGCLWQERITTHGMTKTRTFKSWDSMLQRCTNPNDPSWDRYGGVGVKVVKRWLKFENFYADMGARPTGTTIDRYPDPEGNYGPNNCRWGTQEQQSRNKKNSRWVTYKGQTKMLIDWSREFGIPYDLLLRRVNRGLTEEQLFAPSRSKKVSRFSGVKDED